jgi:cysteine synthase
MTKDSEKLARDISRLLGKSHCTLSEIWTALAVNISFLIAEVPPGGRAEGYADLLKRIEKMIASAKADGLEGASYENPRRDN